VLKGQTRPAAVLWLQSPGGLHSTRASSPPPPAPGEAAFSLGKESLEEGRVFARSARSAVGAQAQLPRLSRAPQPLIPKRWGLFLVALNGSNTRIPKRVRELCNRKATALLLVALGRRGALPRVLPQQTVSGVSLMGIPLLLLPQIPSSCVRGVPPAHQTGRMRLSTCFSFKGLAEDRLELHTYI